MHRPTLRSFPVLLITTLLLSSIALADATSQVPKGLEIPNAKMAFPDVLVGGQPTQAHLAAAADAGFGLVINLRGEGEMTEWDEEAEVEKLGMHYLAIPIPGRAALTEENARNLATALKKKGDSPVLVHCASGNRVGGLFALKAFFVDQMDAQEAVVLGRQAGLRDSLKPTVEEAIQGSSSKPR